MRPATFAAFVILAVTVAAMAAPGPAVAATSSSATTILQDLDRFIASTTYLASDELEGRGPGTAGSLKAAQFIRAEFQKAGLQSPANLDYFQPFTLSESELEERNVIGVLPGAAPTIASVVFMAHFDAYGIDESAEGDDNIFNGARDNAAGAAALIELAHLYSESRPTDVNIVFVAAAAEEIGAQGSRYYVQNPVFPMTDIIVVANIDGVNVTGRRSDFFVMPRDGVNFVDPIVDIAERTGWTYNSPDWVDDMDTSFDTVPFLSRSVPAFTLWTGETPSEGTVPTAQEFGSVHSSDDEINDTWDWSGVAEHLQLYKSVVDGLASGRVELIVSDASRFQPDN